MSWVTGWKRQVDTFHLTLGYGDQVQSPNLELLKNSQHLKSDIGSDLLSSCRYRVELDWSAGDDEDQVVLKLQSLIMITLPAPQDDIHVSFTLTPPTNEESGNHVENETFKNVQIKMEVQKRGELLRVVSLSRTVGSGPSGDGLSVLTRLVAPGSSVDHVPRATVSEELLGCSRNYRSITILNLSNCFLTTIPSDLMKLPLLEKLYLDNNKLTLLPPEVGQLTRLQVLQCDHNALVSVPAELRQCIELVELSLEYNKLVRPLLDFRAMSKLRVLRLFGNPLEFLPEIIPCANLRHLSLANVRIEGDQDLSTIKVDIEAEAASYFVASKHKLSVFFALIFRFSSCQHPLLASALAKMAQDDSNRSVIGKDEGALRQLLSMMLSDDPHVVDQACVALASLAVDGAVGVRLMRADLVQAIEMVLRNTSNEDELLISVLQVLMNLAFTSDAVASRVLTKEILKRLKILCVHRSPEVQRHALLTVGNLAFCWENRRTLVASESLRDLLLRQASGTNAIVCKAAARALAILGENEYLRRAVRGRPISKRGLRILSMDGGGMRGMATVQMLRNIEKGTGRRIHEIFDLICGTSTGGMLAVALGIKRMDLDQCENIYKSLGKLVFAEPIPKDNEAATWREKIDQVYKSSSQNFRVVVHGSKHNAEQFEHLLKEMCADEEGDLLIESAVKGVPKVFVVSALVSVTPAQPFVFRNYQYPPGTPETAPSTNDGPAASVSGTPATATPLTTQVGPRRSAFIGSCKHRIWEAIRASSAAPYYLDDFSQESNRWQDGAIVANNPTIIALREAQLIWPDTQVDCLVSVGCGNVPTKARGKGGWRYLDTGQVLIESACSVERAEEALDTLLPMLPNLQYFRFNPIDDRCDMELDETDAAVWSKLETATQEYVDANAAVFQAACNVLSPPPQADGLWHDKARSTRGGTRGSQLGKGDESVVAGIGWRRRILLVEGCRSPELVKPWRHARIVEAFCARHGLKLELFSYENPPPPITSLRTSNSPFASPLLGSRSPGLYSSEPGLESFKNHDGIPPLSLDPHLMKGIHSLPSSPPLGSRQLAPPVMALQEKLHGSNQVGVVHLALHSDQNGMILSWRSDLLAVAEPGENATEFLQNVINSLRLGLAGKTRAQLPPISNLAGLVAGFPRFSVGGTLYSFMGRHTQVLADGQEVGAYIFRRILASVHLTPDDVRWMVGGWRDRLVLCTGKQGPPETLVKAFLDAGAKAVVVPTIKTDMQAAEGRRS
ncbi:phospholipase A I isoform X2 [Physcomitrium patens]|uniref:Patatin n=1 Tax=Physcomitrium patens TaxID=3218 RepID=A0A7I4F4C8_PHYPA|nr:phospholipase A I-like isoform X2 [Physcomitrium patens]|eukprot:XP_024394241.1 phospholipase A I-like isoform X2 [Physcomitrella patens]